MTIGIDPASFEFIKDVGPNLPTPYDLEQNEVFNLQIVDSGIGCLSYDAENRQWKKLDLPPEYEEERNIALFSRRHRDDEDQVARCDFIKLFVPAPPLSNQAEQKVEEQTFILRGWRYAWVFAPALRRWELTPRGRV